MVVTLSRGTFDKKLRIRVLGVTLSVKEDGKREETMAFPDRASAVAEAEKLIDRRTSRYGWSVVGRTDTDRYLQLLAEVADLRKQVSTWNTLSRRDLQVMTFPPALFERLDGLESEQNVALPIDFRNFVLTTGGLGFYARLENGCEGRSADVCVPGINQTDIRGGFMLVGQAPPSSWAWELALLQLDRGTVTTHVGRDANACDIFENFSEFIEHQCAEVKECVWTMKYELEQA